MIHERELGFRLRRFEQISDSVRRDEVFVSERLAQEQARANRVPEASEHLATLRRTGDTTGFRLAIDGWARTPGYNSFRSFGLMFLNQLVLHDGGSIPAEVLVDVLTVPDDDAGARRKLESLLAHVDMVKKGAQPAPKRVLFLTSLFWSMQDDTRWPCLWASAEDALVALGWLRAWSPSEEQRSQYYLDFRDAVVPLGPWNETESVLFWFNDHRWAGLDPTLPERFLWASELNATLDQSPTADNRSAAEANNAAFRCDLRLLGRRLEGPVSEAIGPKLVPLVAQSETRPGHLRENCWVRWQVGDKSWASKPGLQVLAGAGGVLVGLYPGQRDRGWPDDVRQELAASAPEGMSLHPTSGVATGGDVGADAGSEYVVGRWFGGGAALGREDLADEIVALAAQLQPSFDRLMQLAGGTTALPDGFESEAVPNWLRERFEAFVLDAGYPDDRSDRMNEERRQMAELVQPPALRVQEVAGLRRIFSSSAYGSPGPQSILNTSLRDNEAAFSSLVEALDHLLWAEDDIAGRIDACLDPDRFGIKGLGESVLMKYLAIAHPDRFLPVFPMTNDNGKLRLLEALRVDPPDPNSSRGAQQVAANDLLRARLEPLLPGDPWGQGQFAYWLRDHPAEIEEADPLEAAAAACLLPNTAFLQELRELLEDKGQIVLFGPPGTGKTYIAQALAKALASEPSRRRLVQFHPATSYEDFFEGYRPVATGDGGIAYELTSGPLAELADHAAQDPALHVLVIDELNRANVPKVFGELLFLLEYREEEVSPLYRPAGFSLPKNLWIIATMNTADRSIASLDAALRRRFHFVPIFPGEGPLEGVLERFLEENGGEQTWATLVDMVNSELRERVGNGDLLLGPSHFMKKGLDERLMKRVWEYNVEPLIDDLFFGDTAAIESFRWPAVVRRYRGLNPSAGLDLEAGFDEPAIQ